MPETELNRNRLEHPESRRAARRQQPTSAAHHHTDKYPTMQCTRQVTATAKPASCCLPERSCPLLSLPCATAFRLSRLSGAFLFLGIVGDGALYPLFLLFFLPPFLAFFPSDFFFEFFSFFWILMLPLPFSSPASFFSCAITASSMPGAAR